MTTHNQRTFLTHIADRLKQTAEAYHAGRIDDAEFRRRHLAAWKDAGQPGIATPGAVPASATD
jgi:16S rRNA C1402 (ribose-2'-O) methylase RsmI